MLIFTSAVACIASYVAFETDPKLTGKCTRECKPPTGRHLEIQSQPFISPLFATCHFLFVVHWYRASISNGFRAVASERNQHCGDEARPKGPKREARKAEPGPPGSWRGGLPPPPSFLSAKGFAGALWASPVGSGAKPRPPRCFWCILSCFAVLLCKAVCVGFLYRCTI